jgi:hypothetical protein
VVVLSEKHAGAIVVFMFEFARTEKSGKRRQIETIPHKLRSVGEAKMLAAPLLRHTTFLGMAADVVVIKDQEGKAVAEVIGYARRP